MLTVHDLYSSVISHAVLCLHTDDMAAPLRKCIGAVRLADPTKSSCASGSVAVHAW